MSPFWSWITFFIGTLLTIVGIMLTLLTDWEKLTERRRSYQNWRARRSAEAARQRIATLRLLLAHHRVLQQSPVKLTAYLWVRVLEMSFRMIILVIMDVVFFSIIYVFPGMQSAIYLLLMNNVVILIIIAFRLNTIAATASNVYAFEQYEGRVEEEIGALKQVAGSVHDQAERDILTTRRVQKQLFAAVPGSDRWIDINTVDGVVYIRGMVASQEQIAEVELLIRRIEGVDAVLNLLRLKQAAT